MEINRILSRYTPLLARPISSPPSLREGPQPPVQFFHLHGGVDPLAEPGSTATKPSVARESEAVIGT